MFVNSDRRWLLTATDDQFDNRCTIYWQLTVLFWNDDSHCEMCEQRPVNICYYGVGGRIPRTRCLVASAAFYCWTCFLDSGFNRYLQLTVESICTFCLVHDQRVKPFETRIDAQSLLTFTAFVTGSMTSTFWAACRWGVGTDRTIPYQSLMNRCQGLAGECGRSASAGEGLRNHQQIDQVGHCCPHSQQAILPKSHMQRSLTHGSTGLVDEWNLAD